jgi:tRNA pseudouridine55 synthase
VLTAGRATRLTRFLISAPKVYAGEIRFGTATDTYDAYGTVVAEAPIDELDPEALAGAMRRFLGAQPQMAPPFSAKKIQGRKYYELARRGEEVPAIAKEVTIYEFEGRGPLADGLLPFRLACSSGTYVRSVAHDLGRALGCGAHLASLRRLQVGPFRVEDTTSLDELEQAVAGGRTGSWWVPFDTIPLPFGELTADAAQELRIAHGQAVLIRGLEAGEGDWVKVLNRRRELIAVGAVTERIGAAGVGIVQPKIVFAGRPA